MSKALITEQTLTDIANNIRVKTDEDITMTPSEMQNKIKTGLVSMNEIANGFDYSNFADTADILFDFSGNIQARYNFYNKTPALNINIFVKDNTNANKIFFFYTFSKSNIKKAVINLSKPQSDQNNLFYDCSKLENVEIKYTETFRFFPTSSGSNFKNCVKLKTISGYNLSVGDSEFYGCKSLLDSIFDSNKNSFNNYIQQKAFYGCKSFLNVNFLSYTNLEYIGDSAFYECSNIKSFAISNLKRGFEARTFNNCSLLEALILNCNSVISLSTSNFINNSPIQKGTGYIYVPDALVDSYKTATNQVVYADQIRPISELPQEYKTIYNL